MITIKVIEKYEKNSFDKMLSEKNTMQNVRFIMIQLICMPMDEA